MLFRSLTSVCSIAAALEHTLVSSGRNAYMLDGDNLRHGLNADLGFSEEDRAENVRRVGEVAKILAEAGSVAVVSLVSPYRAERDRVRAIHKEAGIPFYEVFVDTSLEECERRDPKGLYAKARVGEISRAAEAEGVFGVPSFVVDGALFWGREHLGDIRGMLNR